MTDAIGRLRDELDEVRGVRIGVPSGKRLVNADDLRTLLTVVDGDEVVRLRQENKRLRERLTASRANAKRRGQDMLREEANAALPFFTDQWEPLRAIAERAGAQSAQWLTTRARDLQQRGLVESKWLGAERTSSFKLWRKGPGRLPPITTSGQMPLNAIRGMTP